MMMDFHTRTGSFSNYGSRRALRLLLGRHCPGAREEGEECGKEGPTRAIHVFVSGGRATVVDLKHTLSQERSSDTAAFAAGIPACLTLVDIGFYSLRSGGH